MRITGVTHPLGAPVVTFAVAHGAHPRVTMFDHGYLPVRPLAASLSDGEIDPPVSISERVDVLNQKVHGTGHDDRVIAASGSPFEKLAHQPRHLLHARTRMQHGSVDADDLHLDGAELARLRLKPCGQQPMGT